MIVFVMTSTLMNLHSYINPDGLHRRLKGVSYQRHQMLILGGWKYINSGCVKLLNYRLPWNLVSNLSDLLHTYSTVIQLYNFNCL